MFLRFVSCAALALGVVGAAQAQGSAAAPAVEATQTTLTRAQVVADLELWHASGMSFVPHPSGYSDSLDRPEFQRYLQMRSEASAAMQAAGASGQNVSAEAVVVVPER